MFSRNSISINNKSYQSPNYLSPNPKPLIQSKYHFQYSNNSHANQSTKDSQNPHQNAQSVFLTERKPRRSQLYLQKTTLDPKILQNSARDPQISSEKYSKQQSKFKNILKSKPIQFLTKKQNPQQQQNKMPYLLETSPNESGLFCSDQNLKAQQIQILQSHIAQKSCPNQYNNNSNNNITNKINTNSKVQQKQFFNSLEISKQTQETKLYDCNINNNQYQGKKSVFQQQQQHQQQQFKQKNQQGGVTQRPHLQLNTHHNEYENHEEKEKHNIYFTPQNKNQVQFLVKPTSIVNLSEIPKLKEQYEIEKKRQQQIQLTQQRQQELKEQQLQQQQAFEIQEYNITPIDIKLLHNESEYYNVKTRKESNFKNDEQFKQPQDMGLNKSPVLTNSYFLKDRHKNFNIKKRQKPLGKEYFKTEESPVHNQRQQTQNNFIINSRKSKFQDIIKKQKENEDIQVKKFKKQKKISKLTLESVNTFENYNFIIDNFM